jgi:hypothetical protein
VRSVRKILTTRIVARGRVEGEFPEWRYVPPPTLRRNDWLIGIPGGYIVERPRFQWLRKHTGAKDFQ